MTIKWLKAFVTVIAVACSFVALPSSATNAEIIDLDVSAVDPEFRQLFRNAEAFWDSKISGYSRDLPGLIRSQHTGRLFISANTFTGAAGGLLGFAGPTQVIQATTGNIFRQRQWAVAQSSMMSFDNVDLALNSAVVNQEVIIHEMGHALGIGSLWEGNGLLEDIPTRTNEDGTIQRHFRGINARRAFAIDTGRAAIGQTGFVPVEQTGGPGSAFGHWDQSNRFFFNPNTGRRETMTAFYIPGTTGFISDTTIASLKDLHFSLVGDDVGGTGGGGSRNPFNGFPKSGGTARPFDNGGGGGAGGGGMFNMSLATSAVPEPSSLSVLLLGVVGLVSRRRRS